MVTREERKEKEWDGMGWDNWREIGETVMEKKESDAMEENDSET